MRLLCCLPALAFLLVSAAASAQAGTNWRRVQQLPLHTKVHVKATHKSRLCSIESVDEQKLTCSAARVIETSHYTFQRDEIESIMLTRYTVSTAVGAGIGGGAGAAVGAASFHDSHSIVHPGPAAAVLGGTFAIVGGVIGLTSDFLRGPTVYVRH